jgi:hypothetical protein
LGVDSNDAFGGSDFPIFGPDGLPVSSGGDSENPRDPVEELRRANEELRQMVQQERQASKHELNDAKRRVEALQQQVKSVIDLIPSPDPPAAAQQDGFSWDAWNVKPGQKPQPSAKKEEDPNVAISPADFDALYQKKRAEEVDSLRELARKQQEAADQFVRDPRLAPYYNDALVEFQRLDSLMPGKSFEEKMAALHATVGDWISRGWAPRTPYDPKKPGGGIPVGGQNMSGGATGGSDNRFRPDEQNIRGQVGFYSDEQRRADAEHDRRARIQDLETRKMRGQDGMTYDEYFRRKDSKR